MQKIKMLMTEKNYKKEFIRLIIVMFIFIISCAGIGCGVFGNRLQTIIDVVHQQENQLEKDEESKLFDLNEENKEYANKDKREHEKIDLIKNQIKNEIQFTVGEKILIGVLCGIAALLFIYFWLLVIGVTVKISNQYGADYLVFGCLAAVVNVGALIVLYIYKHICKICSKCGKIQQRKATYCSNCGNKIGHVCKSCGHHGKMTEAYCNQCGKKYE